MNQPAQLIGETLSIFPSSNKANSEEAPEKQKIESCISIYLHTSEKQWTDYNLTSAELLPIGCEEEEQYAQAH